MAIEIREITIKTEVRTAQIHQEQEMSARELHQLRDQLLDECKRLILSKTKKKQYKR